MHTPLFIESPDEVLAGIEEESLDIEVRYELLDLFDANGVDSGNVQNLMSKTLTICWPNSDQKQTFVDTNSFEHYKCFLAMFTMKTFYLSHTTGIIILSNSLF